MTRRHADKRIIKYTLIEGVLVLVGISLTLGAIMGGSADISPIFIWVLLIIGVGCLIASGRVGLYVRKLAKQNQLENVAQTNEQGNSPNLPNALV